MLNGVIKYKKEIQKIFERNKVENAFIFGSVLTGKFNENSDVDFLIKFKEGINPLEKGELWWSLHDDLRNLLNREIDIITENSLKNPYFIEELNNTKQKIYG